MMRSPHLSAEMKLLPASEGRPSAVSSGYRGQFHLHGGAEIADVEWYFPNGECLAPGERAYCHIWFARPESHLSRVHIGDVFEIRERRESGGTRERHWLPCVNAADRRLIWG